jgi:hypothetical protein
MLTERWRLVLWSRTNPHLRQSELALLDPRDAKVRCASDFRAGAARSQQPGTGRTHKTI